MALKGSVATAQKVQDLYGNLRSLQSNIGKGQTSTPTSIDKHKTILRDDVQTLITNIKKLGSEATTGSSIYYTYVPSYSLPDIIKGEIIKIDDVVTAIEKYQSLNVNNAVNSNSGEWTAWTCWDGWWHCSNNHNNGHDSTTSTGHGRWYCSEYDQWTNSISHKNGRTTWSYTNYVGYKVNSSSQTGNCGANTCQVKL